MDDLLPLLLWVFAVVWMLSVCGICIVRSRFGTGERHPEVNPVSWNVVLAQMVSVLFAGIPFMVYLMASEELSPAFHDFYTDHLVIGAAIVIVLVCGAVADGYPGASRAFHRSRPRGPRRHAYRGVTHASVRREYIVDVIDASHRGKSIRRQFRRVQFDVP